MTVQFDGLEGLDSLLQYDVTSISLAGLIERRAA
jgi:hypothetical protein